MTNANIKQKPKIGKRKFSATYLFLDRARTNHRVYLQDLIDIETNKIIKEACWINAKSAKDVLFYIKEGDLIEFEAIIKPNSCYHNKFKIINPKNVTIKESI